MIRGTRNAVHADPLGIFLPLHDHCIRLLRQCQYLEWSVGLVIQLVTFHAAIVQVEEDALFYLQIASTSQLSVKVRIVYLLCLLQA